MLKLERKQNRRRRERQLLNTSVQLFTGAAKMSALGINVSDVGMCLFTLANLPLRSEVQLEFLPPNATETVRVSGTIRHRALYLYGIEFVDETTELLAKATTAATVSSVANS